MGNLAEWIKWIAVAAATFGVCIGGIIAAFTVPARLHERRVAKIRPAALQETMCEGAEITRAIEAYTRANRKPPGSLQALVPRYLKTLPLPTRLMGNGWRSGWQYEIAKKPIAGKWALWVWVRREYQPNVGSFGDIFAFHPSGKYRQEDYGGVLERVGAWGYYNE